MTRFEQQKKDYLIDKRMSSLIIESTIIIIFGLLFFILYLSTTNQEIGTLFMVFTIMAAITLVANYMGARKIVGRPILAFRKKQ